MEMCCENLQQNWLTVVQRFLTNLLSKKYFVLIGKFCSIKFYKDALWGCAGL